jgi:hypothetical protein
MDIINDGCCADVHRCSFNVFFKEPLHAYQVLWFRVRQTANSVLRAHCNESVSIYFLNVKLRNGGYGVSPMAPMGKLIGTDRTGPSSSGYLKAYEA